MKEYAIFVGVDWGSESHQLCAVDDSRKVLLESAFPHSGKGLDDLVSAVLKLTGGDPQRIAVAIEIPRGPVVETLVERGVAVFTINPKQLDRFRDRHCVAGAKDDRRDALVLADSLRTDKGAFRRVQLGEPWLVQVRELSRIHDELKAERIALGSRLREQLHRYFPQILELDSVYEARWLWELLDLASTPDLAKRVSISRLRSLLKKYRIRSLAPEQVQQVLRATPVHVAPGVTEACRRHVALLVARLRLVDKQKAEVEREIDVLLQEMTEPVEGKSEHRDALLLQSLPGLGKLVCATMLAEASEPLLSRDYTRLRALCGVAPVTKRSGKQLSVVMRTSCNHRLRTAVHYWVGNAVQRDPHWKGRYAALRASGKRHARAMRAIGDRLLAVLIAVLQSNTPYDPARLGAVQGPTVAVTEPSV